MSSTICCVDLTGLAMLELPAGGGSSRWVWQRNRISSSEARPASSSCDAARQQLEDAARDDFAAAGGGNCGTAADVWRTAFVRRRIALVVGGARRVLGGQLSPPELPDANAIQRKKDAPGDGEAAQRFVAAQMAMQKVANRRARNRDRTLVASAAEVLSANGKVWAAPRHQQIPLLNTAWLAPQRVRATLGVARCSTGLRAKANARMPLAQPCLAWIRTDPTLTTSHPHSMGSCL